MTNEIKEILFLLHNDRLTESGKTKLEDYIFDLQTRIDKAIDKAQLIRDIGFDYDGFNDSESLKILIDELVKYAGDIKKILRGEE